MEIVKRAEKDNCIIAAVNGRIDAVTAPEFERQLNDWVAQGRSDLLMDLNGLDYISSAGLRSMLGIAKKLKKDGRALMLCSLTDTVKEVFDISGFNTIIPIYNSVETALKKR
ncbi:MAG: STAS domain-containing protein [Desulfatiglandaceae bacterium]